MQNNLIQIFVQSREGGSGFELYKNNLSESLQENYYDSVYRDETQSEEKYYSLGTVSSLNLDGQNYLLFALTETELRGCIPDDNCDVSKMWIALESLWNQSRIYARGDYVNIPLIGSGVTGIRLHPSQLLELNLLAIANSIEEGGQITTEKISIILHPKYIEDINLSDFQSMWN